jgi:energy-coupling factor transport system substrate-specific component
VGDLAARRPALRLSARSAIALTLVSVAGLMMFLWPLALTPPDEFSHHSDAPFIFALILPGLIAVVLAELHGDRGVRGRGGRAGGAGMDTKALAMLGVLTAIGAALRPMGAGIAGIETVFFMLILAGRVYGPGFGFVLGSTTLFASALLTGGIGPWLPFQMLASSWVGLGAGLLPRARGRAEVALLAAYGVFAAYAFGFLLNMWFWPFAIGTDTQLSFVAGDPVLENLHRFFLYTVATSTLGWDTGRAITNALAIVVLGPAVLAVLRRSTRRAAFDAPVEFAAPVDRDAPEPTTAP